MKHGSGKVGEKKLNKKRNDLWKKSNAIKRFEKWKYVKKMYKSRVKLAQEGRIQEFLGG